MSGIRIMIEQYGPLFDVWIDGMRHYDLDRDAVYQLVNDSLYPRGAVAYPKTGVPATDERRQKLLTWMRPSVAPLGGSAPRVSGLTAKEIVKASQIYLREGHYADARCFDDLKVLEKLGFVKREGRPALWSAS